MGRFCFLLWSVCLCVSIMVRFTKSKDQNVLYVVCELPRCISSLKGQMSRHKNCVNVKMVWFSTTINHNVPQQSLSLDCPVPTAGYLPCTCSSLEWRCFSPCCEWHALQIDTRIVSFCAGWNLIFLTRKTCKMKGAHIGLGLLVSQTKLLIK